MNEAYERVCCSVCFMVRIETWGKKGLKAMNAPMNCKEDVDVRLDQFVSITLYVTGLFVWFLLQKSAFVLQQSFVSEESGLVFLNEFRV